MSDVAWRMNLVGGLLLMVAVSAFVGFDGYFFIDEAAIHAQIEVREQGEWTVPRPLADFDTDRVHAPMARSTVVGDEYAPFGKHPLHTEILHLANVAGGRLGVRLVSTVGTWVAAVAAGLLALRAGRRVAVTAFWLTLVASPLVFHAQLVVAHALAAGVAAMSFVAVDRLRGVKRLLVVAGLLLFAALVRSEVVLLAGALGAVLCGRGVLRRRIDDVVTGITSVSAGLAGYLLDPWLVERIIGGDTGPQVISSGSRGGATGRLSGIQTALFGAASGGYEDRAAMLVALVGVLGTSAAVLVYRRSRDAGPALLMAGLAVVSGLALVRYPTTVPGLLWSFPLLLAAGVLLAAGLRVGLTDEQQWQWTLPTAGLFMLAVLAVQYEVVGGLEWGWRYVAIALPLVTPALATILHDRWTRAGSAHERAVWVLVAAAFLLVPLAGLREQRRLLGDTQFLLDRTDETVTSDVDWIVTLDPSFGRFNYPHSIRGSLVTATTSNADSLLAELADRGADEILVVWRDEPEPPDFDPGPFTAVGDRTFIASGYRAEIRSTG